MSQSKVTYSPSLRAAIHDGVANAVKIGAGETYISPFAIFLKGTPIQIGLLSSLAPFIGALLQGLGVWLSEHFRGRRRFIWLTAAIEALVWLPIAALPYLFTDTEFSVNVLIGLLICYHCLAGIATPVWSSLIGDLVDPATRGRFFGRRNRLGGIATFVTLLLCGQFLHLFEASHNERLGYLVIFVIAAASRLMSALYLSRYDDVPYQVRDEHRFSFWDFIRRSHKSNFARFVIFVGMMSMSLMVAGPYFAVHMLRELKFSYGEFTVISAALLVSQFLAIERWGILVDRYGAKKILSLTSFCIAFIPIFWLFTYTAASVVLLQLFGGFIWAGFNLAASNFLFDAVSPPKRSRCVAYQSIVNGSGVLLGSLIGGFLITHTEFFPSLGRLLSGGVSPYPSLFLLSGILRLGTCIIFVPLFREVRPVEPIANRNLIFQIVHLRPISGLTLQVVSDRSEESAAFSTPHSHSESPQAPANEA